TRDREPLLLTARDFHPALADHRVEPAIGPLEQPMRRRAAQHVEALGIARVRLHEREVLANRSGEELRVLRDEADPLAELVEVHLAAVSAVVGQAALSRA